MLHLLFHVARRREAGENSRGCLGKNSLPQYRPPWAIKYSIETTKNSNANFHIADRDEQWGAAGRNPKCNMTSKSSYNRHIFVMFFSRLLQVVYKTTGGRAWNSSGSLKPLSGSQKRRRRQNTELTLKNMSVLKMAAANEPEVTAW